MKHIDPRMAGALAVLVSLGACVMPPVAPTIPVAPGPNKTFEAFATEQSFCQQYATAQTAPQAYAATNQAVATAVLTTALGAALGGAIGGGHGAGIGAASGAVAGTALGAGGSGFLSTAALPRRAGPVALWPIPLRSAVLLMAGAACPRLLR